MSSKARSQASKGTAKSRRSRAGSEPLLEDPDVHSDADDADLYVESITVPNGAPGSKSIESQPPPKKGNFFQQAKDQVARDRANYKALKNEKKPLMTDEAEKSDDKPPNEKTKLSKKGISGMIARDRANYELHKKAEEERKGYGSLEDGMDPEEQKKIYLVDQYFRLMHDTESKDAAIITTWKTDVVLAFQPEMGKNKKMAAKYRDIFLKKLRRFGLKMQIEPLEESQDGKTCFVKVHAPFSTLAAIAELNNVRMPVKPMEPEDEDAQNLVDCCFRGRNKNPFRLPPEFQEEDVDYYDVPFKRNKLRMFEITSKDTFFTVAQRIRMVWEIILKTQVFPEDLTKRKLTPMVEHPCDINFLILKNVFVAAYPLHEGDLEYMVGKPEKRVPMEAVPSRCWLVRTWATKKVWKYYQPLGSIRAYFGECIAFYYAWLGFYTQMLILPSILGMIAFLYGVITVSFDVPTQDLCHNSTIMCRLCPSKACTYTTMDSYCTDVEMTYVMDNYSTPVFAFIIALWATVFLEKWKRRQATLALKWDVYDFEADIAESIRPEYYRAATLVVSNPITEEEERIVPKHTRLHRLVQSISTLLAMVILTLGLIASIILFKSISSSLFTDLNVHFLFITPTLMATLVGSLVGTVCIMILEKIYGYIAWSLTEREYPRTESQFERSYVYKMFIFQFVNFYGYLAYYAFFDGKLAGSPESKSIFDDRCAPGSCFESLCTQFLTILLIKQLYSNIAEVYLPKLGNWWRRRKNKASTDSNPYSQWEKDFDLGAPPRLQLAPEYFEMCLQYGLVTMWSAAFPLAPLFALINNCFELRIDAFKFIGEYRRPVPVQARDIGVYMELLGFLSTAAVVFNGAIICFSTSIIDRIYYQIHHEGSLEGFWTQELSIFNPLDWHDPSLIYSDTLGVNVTSCLYTGMRTPPGAPVPYVYRQEWYHIMLIKVVFLLIFENVIFFVQKVIDYLTPDIPEDVELKQQREQYIARTMLYNAEFPTATKDHQAHGIMAGVSTKPESVAASTPVVRPTTANTDATSMPPDTPQSVLELPSPASEAGSKRSQRTMLDPAGSQKASLRAPSDSGSRRSQLPTGSQKASLRAPSDSGSKRPQPPGSDIGIVTPSTSIAPSDVGSKRSQKVMPSASEKVSRPPSESADRLTLPPPQATVVGGRAGKPPSKPSSIASSRQSRPRQRSSSKGSKNNAKLPSLGKDDTSV